MTSEQLDAKYSQLTGLRFKVSELVENAGDDENAKKATYDHLVWHIKNGLIRGVDGIKELVEEVLPALQDALGQQSSAEPSEEEVYTAAEAAAYNAQLEGAKTTNDWKVEPQEAVIGQDAIEGVHYTEEEVLSANAALDGALEAGEHLTEEQAGAYNIAVTGASKEAEDTLTEEEAAMYNAHLEGAISTEDWKVEPQEAIEAKDAVEGIKYTQEEADEYNAQLPGAVKAGDPKTNA